MKAVVTIILAAGTGKRLGGPKALLAWPSGIPEARGSSTGAGSTGAGAKSAPPKPGKEVPLAIAQADARLGAESARVLVVVRAAYMKPLLRHVRVGLDLLVSEAAEELGPAGSLAVAAPRVGDAEAVIVTPVDALPAKRDTVQKLLAALEADPSKLAARPVYKGKNGHPVALRPAALARYAEPSPPSLRDHLRALGDAVVGVEVNDPTVLIDLNTAADVMGHLRALPRFLD
jgi:CTP:molybdopterin cytidylyltransferase MocA